MTRLAFLRTAAATALVASAVFAAPVTTVPWNGKQGAVSFTYDDARSSQIPNLLPQLDSLGIKATFFISIQNIGDFNAKRAAWIQAARKGHELTNHTYAHANVNGSDGAAVTAMIKDMADTLRGVDTSIQSVTFAYPNCNLTANATAKNGISAQNFALNVHPVAGLCPPIQRGIRTTAGHEVFRVDAFFTPCTGLVAVRIGEG